MLSLRYHLLDCPSEETARIGRMSELASALKIVPGDLDGIFYENWNRFTHRVKTTCKDWSSSRFRQPLNGGCIGRSGEHFSPILLLLEMIYRERLEPKRLTRPEREARKALAAQEAEKALSAYEAAQRAFHANRERLKAERLAREGAAQDRRSTNVQR